MLSLFQQSGNYSFLVQKSLSRFLQLTVATVTFYLLGFFHRRFLLLTVAPVSIFFKLFELSLHLLMTSVYTTANVKELYS